MPSHGIETKAQLTTRLKCVENLMVLDKLYAEYWMAQATTGAAKSRKIYKGGLSRNEPLTDDELVVDALETANRHISNFRQHAEDHLSILHKLEEYDGSDA